MSNENEACMTCPDMRERFVVRRWGEINGKVMGVVATERYAHDLIASEVERNYGERADYTVTSNDNPLATRWMYRVYDRRAWEDAGSEEGREVDYLLPDKEAFWYEVEAINI